MTQNSNALLNWPHQVPSAVMHCLADAHFVHGLELGPPEWWQNWQSERLKAMLQWLETMPWWQNWASRQVDSQSAYPALAGLPIMRREDFRAMIESHEPMAPPDHGTLRFHTTSGSSGVPVSFWRSDLALRINSNHYWADHQRQGRDLRATMAIITGTPGPHEDTHKEVLGEPWLQPGPQLARNAPQFSMLEHAHWLCDNPVTYLATTPATLSAIISLVKIKRLAAPRFEQVLTSSHMVDPALRERTRRVLGASIRDRYSCEELGPIAFQCPESDDYYHVAVGNVMLEVVDDAGKPTPDGTPGNVLVTGLNQWASPAIRYDLGDIATAHPQCPGCGATVPALSQLLGRKYFLLNEGSGQLRHVRILAEHWLACAPVREHRLVQTDPQSFRVELVLDHPMVPRQRSDLLSMLRKLVGKDFTFDIAQLDTIPWPPGRKRQEFVGLLP